MNHVTYISAGAGSGKTFTLTSILADLIIKQKATPEQFILTTFTEAAAAEFKEKAKAKIYEQQQTPRYAEYAERLDQAMIGTVDSIAYSFVQKYWHLLGISPNLKMIDDEQKKFFIGQILASIATSKETAFLKEFCEEFRIMHNWSDDDYGLNYDFWKDDVKEIFEKAKSYDVKDLKESCEKSISFAKESTKKITGKNTDTEPLNYDIDLLKREMNDIRRIDAGISSADGRTKNINKFSFILSKELTIRNLADFKSFLKNITPKDCFRTTDLYQDALASLNNLYTNTKVRDLVIEYINLIFDYVEKAQAAFQEYKDKQHLIDFTDMEVRFLELLDKKEVQDDIRNAYKYVFVDEFQDSSPIQVKIFDKLSEIVGSDECDDLIVTVGEGGGARDFHTHNSIWVGDFKQAIYGFRGADTDLTKAVADIIASKQAANPKQFKIHSLEKSYRSLEDIVSFTNDVFVPAFAGMLSREQVELQSHRGNPDRIQSLRCWKAENLASQIAKRVKEGEDPSDYAVLARSNSDLDKLSKELNKLNIPVCRDLIIDEKRDELPLLSAFLNLVINDKDNYSKALIAFLSEKDFDVGKLVDTKLEFNKTYDEAKKKAEAAGEGNPELPAYLANNKLISKFMENLSFYKVQTIHNLVESLIIGLDLYTVGRSWKDVSGTDEAFNALIEASYNYEERCAQAGLPPTINGYIDFCKENAKSSGSKNGVTLATFHGSKGLEWKKVILVGMDKDAEDEKDVFKYDVFGVQNYHEIPPSETNLFPPMIINLMPKLFTGNTNVADDMAANIRNAERYNSICTTSKSETIRLLYVAITRAKDQLILTTDGGKQALYMFKCLGCDVADGYNFEADNTIDLFNNNHPFLYEDRQLEDGEVMEARDNLKYVLNSNPKAEKESRDMQPSKAVAYEAVEAKELFSSGKRIAIKADSNEFNKIGTCIHEIFAFIEKDKNVEKISSIIKSSSLEEKIPNPAEILEAWNNLEGFMTKTYGKGKTAHEVPFKHFNNGQIFTGSIDFIWETADGVVLVDFKSYPGSKDDVVNPEHKHYAGIYAGQFECYERALTAAGKKVLAKLVYYHVLGVVVKLD